MNADNHGAAVLIVNSIAVIVRQRVSLTVLEVFFNSFGHLLGGLILEFVCLTRDYHLPKRNLRGIERILSR